MTYFNLKAEIMNHNPGSHYFDKATLKFFGIRESESSVLKEPVTIDGHTCWVLSERQHNAPAGIPQRHYKYFDILTFDEIFPG